MGPARDVVDISSDEEEGFRRLSADPLGWVSKLFDRVVAIGDSPEPPQKKDGSDGVGEAEAADQDCVVLDGDPDRPVAVAGEMGAASDEPEIVAVKGQIACRDFPHARHSCSEFPFSTTLHVKHCSKCYCFVCDAPAPCNNWDKGLSNDDHCHATDKETKWKTLRKLLKLNNLAASHSERHSNALYPTTSSLERQ
ncbi:uncharacterized protein LOC123429561 [Hordeum vulgare subsp. vulgare]|uniref:uncharacterized protein LOC123429561 n=1 Tax=Hordeum vulgare subsp. vulgare TaxID=112509 RepID=UPI000B472293|nr:uncharacterized protein LOC123429561 [Hordeum vulgare subsp. vulgare]